MKVCLIAVAFDGTTEDLVYQATELIHADILPAYDLAGMDAVGAGQAFEFLFREQESARVP